MENLTGLLVAALVGALMVWLGFRTRKKAYEKYESDKLEYTASTTMTVIKLDEEEIEDWREMDDGSRERIYYTVYLPTYEYTVNGRTYTYKSGQSISGSHLMGRQVPGYYDPQHPERITENKPSKPVLGGGLFFLFAALCLVAVVVLAREIIVWGL